MILRLPTPTTLLAFFLLLHVLAANSSWSSYLVGAYSPPTSSTSRPRFAAGPRSAPSSPTSSYADTTTCNDASLSPIRRRRGGLPLRAIAPDETDVRSRSNTRDSRRVRAAVVASSLAQAEKAAEAAVAASRRRAGTTNSCVSSVGEPASSSATSATIDGRSPGFVGFRPREATFDRNDGSNNNDISKVDPRPAVTVRPGPGVTITRTSGSVVVASAAAEDESEEAVSAAHEDASESSEGATEEGSGSSAARAAATAALLRRRAMNSQRDGGSKSNTKVGRSKTSVGAMKTGSARRAGGTVAGRLLGTVRTAAAAAAAARQKKDQSNSGGGDGGDGGDSAGDDTKMSASTTAAATAARQLSPTKSLIQSTVNELMKKQEDRRAAATAASNNSFGPQTCETQTSAMGLFGEPLSPSNSQQQSQGNAYDAQLLHERAFHNYVSHWQPPHSGSILLHPESTSSNQNNPAYSNADYFAGVKDRIAIRVATPWDDIDIANLRLSVFSEFTPELRQKFCRKSCEVLDHRRNKGATCLVAAIDRSMRVPIVERNTYQDGGDYGIVSSQPRDDTASSQWFMGSVECSVHEFFGTELGRRRPAGTVLYITEVAVLPEARRTGAATRLMLGVDELAIVKGIESLYLHVDVNNKAAITLYEKAGYRVIGKDDHPMFEEFTTRLNLHDGATKGRNHYLMEKHLTESPTWFEAEEAFASRQLEEARALQRARAERENNTRSIGFDVPIHYSGRL